MKNLNFQQCFFNERSSSTAGARDRDGERPIENENPEDDGARESRPDSRRDGRRGAGDQGDGNRHRNGEANWEGDDRPMKTNNRWAKLTRPLGRSGRRHDRERDKEARDLDRQRDRRDRDDREYCTRERDGGGQISTGAVGRDSDRRREDRKERDGDRDRLRQGDDGARWDRTTTAGRGWKRNR